MPTIYDVVSVIMLVILIAIFFNVAKIFYGIVQKIKQKHG